MGQQSERKIDGFLVVARYSPKKFLVCKPKGDKIDYPLFTVICDTPEEAIAVVRRYGFCLNSSFVLRAIRVALVGGE